MSGLINVVRKAKPFFSKLDEAAKELPRTKGTGKEFMTELKKQPGVKKAEIEDRKLTEIESMPKMTKQEFLKKIEEKPAPEISEKVLGSKTNDPEVVNLAEEMIRQEINGRLDAQNFRSPMDRENAYIEMYDKIYKPDYEVYLDEAASQLGKELGQPKYNDPKLVLPGGENYREILLKLPIKKGDIRVVNSDGDIVAEGFFDREGADQYRRMAQAETGERLMVEVDPMGEAYKSSHWTEPNVLAHIRVSDRKGPNGEKILHVEEIQSDWHQAGRKEGYRTPVIEARRKELQDLAAPYYESGRALPPDLRKEIESLPPMTAVPDAPFKKNWHELAMKRVMDYATEGGYDKVAITPGREQADRYNLAKYIKSIQAQPVDNGEGYIMKIVDKDGNVIANHRYETSELPDQVGKEMADKIISSGGGRFEGLDLQVGGEGMTGFYDQILPAYINREYGKYGAKVGKLPIQTGEEVTSKWLGTSTEPGVQPTFTELHSIDITPEMREAIKTKGQPLYQAIGTGAVGSAAMPEEPKEQVHISDNPDAMMLELENKGFAGGGLLKKAAKAIKGTQEVLPAAEREENLRKMLDQSRVKERLYHATPKSFKEFKPGGEDPTISGPAIWLTPNAEYQPAAHNVGGGERGFKEGVNVMPVHVQAKNPLVIDDPTMIEWAREVFAGGSREFPELMAPKWADEIRKEGYDSIILADPFGKGNTHEVIMFEPNKIKSAIGNRGTYDVTDPDINKAVGGLTKAKRK